MKLVCMQPVYVLLAYSEKEILLQNNIITVISFLVTILKVSVYYLVFLNEQKNSASIIYFYVIVCMEKCSEFKFLTSIISCYH